MDPIGTIKECEVKLNLSYKRNLGIETEKLGILI